MNTILMILVGLFVVAATTELPSTRFEATTAEVVSDADTKRTVDEEQSMNGTVSIPVVRAFSKDVEDEQFGDDQSEFQQQMLDAHNSYRARHCSPPLRLDAKLNRLAREYAEDLASIGRLEVNSRRDLGQNLWMMTNSFRMRSVDGATATDNWYKGLNSYDFEDPRFSRNSGQFTQLVWKDSKRLGAGYAFSRDGRSVFVVAFYSPPGNVLGAFPRNVSPDSC